MSLRAKANRLRELHHGPRPLRLLNAWDAGSARVFESRGAPALGTTSAGIAFALGRADGDVERDAMVEAIGRIARAVDVPLSADVEAGYGDTPARVGETVRLVIEAGAVGINLEDAAGRDGLLPLDQQVERVRAARMAAEKASLPLFINARTDVYWLKIGEPGEDRFEHAAQRLTAYVAAGADGVFVPGLTERDEIVRIARTVRAPLNVLASPELPPIAELARIGVARVSTGSGPARATLALAARIADEYQDAGTFEAMSATALPYAEANALFA